MAKPLGFVFLLFLLQFLHSNSQIYAPVCTGLDVDGTDDDWYGCSSVETVMNMMQVGLPSNQAVENGIKIQIAHDDTHMYMLLKVRGNYYFNLTAGNGFSHSVAVMWQVGSKATMYNMGGCTPLGYNGDTYNCSAIQSYCSNNNCSCEDYMTDVWHIEAASPGSLPGVQYPLQSPVVFPRDGSYKSYAYNPNDLGAYQLGVERLTSGNDHTSNTDDEFSVHPCLRGDDGHSGTHLQPYQMISVRYRNQLKYAWSHTAINTYAYPFASPAADGWYTYEFSRPLHSQENTDVKFEVGKSSNFSVAFWIPQDDEEWGDSDHYVAPATFQFATVELMNVQDSEVLAGNQGSTVKPVMTASIMFAIAAFMASM